MEIHELNTRESLSGADFFAVDNGTDTAKVSYSALSAAVLGDITGAASTIVNNNLTASRVLVSNGSGKIGVSGITTTVLNRLSGLTENVQTALDSKAPTASPALTGTPTAPTAAAGTNTPQIATTAFVLNALSGRFPTYSMLTANKPRAASNRVGSILGGYVLLNGVVYYAIRCTAAMGFDGNDYWTIFEGMPTPPIEQAMPAAIVAKGAPLSAYVGTDGKVVLCLSSAIASGDNNTLCGMYFTA